VLLNKELLSNLRDLLFSIVFGLAIFFANPKFEFGVPLVCETPVELLLEGTVLVFKLDASLIASKRGALADLVIFLSFCSSVSVGFGKTLSEMIEADVSVTVIVSVGAIEESSLSVVVEGTEGVVTSGGSLVINEKERNTSPVTVGSLIVLCFSLYHLV